MKSWQIGADCPIIVDNKAFQQGHKSMTDGDTVGGGYRLIFPPMFAALQRGKAPEAALQGRLCSALTLLPSPFLSMVRGGDAHGWCPPMEPPACAAVPKPSRVSPLDVGRDQGWKQLWPKSHLGTSSKTSLPCQPPSLPAKVPGKRNFSPCVTNSKDFPSPFHVSQVAQLSEEGPCAMSVWFLGH